MSELANGSAVAPTRVSPIAFVEPKTIDWPFLRSALEESERRNHWANFGPSSMALESDIEATLKLPSDRRVVSTASGTTALHALVLLHEVRARRPLRWVVSAFGFACSVQGPLADAQVVDCDAYGMLDVHRIDEMDPTSYDGIIVTNVFGLASDLSSYVRRAEALGKILICDAAGAFDADHRTAGDGPLREAISFHHTKPWGMGEGGAVVLPEEWAPAFRSIINFGLVPGHDTGPHSTNGKLSDIAAAAIRQRLAELPEVRQNYQLQHQRIAGIAADLGYSLLQPALDLELAATPPCVALLAPHPVAESALVNDVMVLRKYYKPLAASAPVAAAIYGAIVNAPSHPEMAAASDSQIAKALGHVLSAARPE